MKRIKIGINKLITSTKKQLKKIKKEHLIRQFTQDNLLLIIY